MTNVMLCATGWDGLNTTQYAQKERELQEKFWADMVKSGAQMVRHYNTLPSAETIVMTILTNPPLRLLFVEELQPGVLLRDTSAGKAALKNNQENKDAVERDLAKLGPEDSAERDRLLKKGEDLDNEEKVLALPAENVLETCYKAGRNARLLGSKFLGGMAGFGWGLVGKVLNLAGLIEEPRMGNDEKRERNVAPNVRTPKVVIREQVEGRMAQDAQMARDKVGHKPWHTFRRSECAQGAFTCDICSRNTKQVRNKVTGPAMRL